MPCIKVKDGREFQITETDSGVFVEIDGRRFVAPDCAHLRHGLSKSEHGVYVPPEREPTKTRGEHWLHKFEHGAVPEKQEALNHVRQLASEGVTRAQEIVQIMDAKPAPSTTAQQVANTLRKKFEDVSPEEITQHVNNIVLRSKVIAELAERLKVVNA